MNASAPFAPNPGCHTCTKTYKTLLVDVHVFTLGNVLDKVVYGIGGMQLQGDVCVYHNARLLYDADFDDNRDRTLHDLGIGYGSMVSISSEEDTFVSPIMLSLFQKEGSDEFLLQGPEVVFKQPTAPETPNDSLKRKVDNIVDLEDDVVVVESVTIASPVKIDPMKLNGLFAVNKPSGITSNDVLDRIKGLFSSGDEHANKKRSKFRKKKTDMPKVGHGGTLVCTLSPFCDG
jgi:hypothetical protein